MCGVQGERSIRGTGVYDLTNMINHSCMPTAARVEDPDKNGPERMCMRVQLLQVCSILCTTCISIDRCARVGVVGALRTLSCAIAAPTTAQLILVALLFCSSH